MPTPQLPSPFSSFPYLSSLPAASQLYLCTSAGLGVVQSVAFKNNAFRAAVGLPPRPGPGGPGEEDMRQFLKEQREIVRKVEEFR